jgi:hypothetical protein
MPPKPASIRLRAPQLDDAAVVEIHAFLEDLMLRFESRYGPQMRRFYNERDRRNRTQYELKLNHKTDDDAPF